MSSFWKTTLSWLDVKIQTFHSFNYRRGLKFFNIRAKIMRSDIQLLYRVTLMSMIARYVAPLWDESTL